MEQLGKKEVILSVVIPVYNAEKYLSECLDSILCQSLEAIEIICVDDGSTDKSLNILKEYAQKDSRIKILCQNNEYAGIARNNGLEHASGKWVHFMDADDWIATDAYSKWISLAEDQEADMCVSLHVNYDQDKNEEEKRNRTPNNRYLITTDLAHHADYFFHSPVVPWNKIYRREFLQNNNLRFDDNICCNDRSMYFKSILRAKRITIVREYWPHYRKDSHNLLTGNLRLKNFTCHFKSFENTWDSYLQEDDYIKSMLLDVTIEDFMNFYHRAIGTEYQQDVARQLGEYLMNMDLTPLGHDIYQYRWYKEYLELSGKVESKAVSEKRKRIESVTKQNKQLRKENESIKKELERLNASKSYKLGLRLTFLPRTCYKTIRCLFKYGLNHTIQSIRTEVKRKVENSNSNAIMQKQQGLNQENRKTKITVSLTSYPQRISFVSTTLESLLNQSLKPDRIILWLAEDEFPNKEKDLPSELLELKKDGILIEWCENIRSYKKLIPTLRKYSNDIIVTCDDDVIVDKNWLKLLYESYKKETTTFIHCHRITRFYFALGKWNTISAGKSTYLQPSYLHKLVGVGGVLYPPHCLSTDVLNMEKALKIAPTNDDIWFWVMAVLNKVKIKVVEGAIPCPKIIEGSQVKESLKYVNDVGEKLFWKDFNAILAEYSELNEIFSEEYDLMKRINRLSNVEKKDEAFYASLELEDYKPALMLWYKQACKRYLNLDNPRTFNEKIQWLKLYDSTQIKTRLADKYLVRQWVKDTIGEKYLIPLLGVWEKFEQIDFSALPMQFVLKMNHSSGYNYIVKDKMELNYADIKDKFSKWSSYNFAFRAGLELHYMNIPPRILAEKYMAGLDGVIYDYRFFCFNGEPKYLWLDLGSGTINHQRNIYDIYWNKLEYKVNYPQIENKVEKPECYDEMVVLVRKMCKGFSFVRIDFYVVNKQPYFGEMTFTPQSGQGKWEKEEQNFVYGDLIILPKESEIPIRTI